jgi:hypothetical protein
MQIIDTQPTANISQNQVITWYIEELLAQSSKVVQFKARLDNDMPVGTNYLPNTVIVSAINEDTTQLSNNKSILTLVNQVEQPPPTWQPEIKAFPARVDVTDSIFLSINVPVQVTEYDIIVSLPDGAINRAFADEFIQSHRILSPNQWYDIPKPYLPRHLVTERPEEEIIFKIKATDQFGQTKTAQTSVIVSSNNYLVLDRNVYRPEIENPLKINFKLSYRRNAALDIYDLTGRHITQLTKDVYDGGWNTFLWDVRMENGIKAGSGVYLVTLRAGEYNSWKKFIIVR